jgi:hypothetical protein
VDWIITGGLAIILAVALPPAIVAAKKSVRGNSRMAGAALSIGLAFSMMYDPRKKEVIENIAKRESGGADRNHQRFGEANVFAVQ